MGGWGSLGMSQSESEAKSRTGFRGTQYEGAAATQGYESGKKMTDFGNMLMASPGAMMNYGKQMLPGGQYGLGENADQAVGQYGKMMMANSSADIARKGGLSPENQGNVIGSAIQNSLPFLIPQVQQFQAAQFMAPQNLMQVAKTSADYWNRALGAQSDASSNSWSFNVAGGGGATG